jgi:predicted transcriptional regulator
MLKVQQIHNGIYRRIRAMSNGYRFRILELTQGQQMNITELSKALRLSYTKCADYVRLLEKEGLVEKTRKNREMLVRSKVVITPDNVKFSK